MDADASDTSPKLLCIACGYDLRELDEEGNCPECGLAIARSIGGDHLERADPKWLRSIMLGQTFLAWGLSCVPFFIGVWLVFILFIAFTFMLKIPAWINAIFGFLLVVLFCLLALCGLLFLTIGVFLVTTCDPRIREREAVWCARHMTRYGIILLVVFSVVTASVPALNLGMGGPVIMNGSIVLIFFAFTVMVISLIRHLAMLIHRTPNPQLSQRMDKFIKFFNWALPAIIGLRVIRLLISIWVGPAAPAFGTSLTSLTSCAESILYLAVVWRLINLSQFMLDVRRVFQMNYELARDDSLS